VGLSIVPATAADVPLVLQFIRDLAVYERLESKVVATEADLQRWLFGTERVAEAVIARDGEEALGFALFFPVFSTFLGRPGIYLEDLFIRESARGRGVGRALLTHLARLAVSRGWGRVDWSVLDWNEPAIAFYRRIGAEPQSEWRIWRLSGAALERLAQEGVRS
jgi:GNAT superfamily N-acetyltransferase